MRKKRIRDRKKPVWYADFETTQPNKEGRVRVYLWCILKGSDVFTGDNLESFINHIKDLKCVIYFHNLTFDFSYIQYYFIENNIDYEITEKKGTIYKVKYNEVEFRDSMNFMPMSLEKVGENYCQNFKKTKIDYSVDYDHKPTKREINYCINDCRVLEEGLTNYFKALESVLLDAECYKTVKKMTKKLTNAGIAFDAFKELSLFEECCPKTTSGEYKAFRYAYKGGYVYSNPKGIIKGVKMIDCNSEYPFIYSTIDLPIGRPIKCHNFDELNKHKFYIVCVELKYDLKEGYIPIIGGGVSKWGGTLYKSSSDNEYEEHTLCNIDLELIKEFYEVDIFLKWGVWFDTVPYFYKKYSDIFIEVKNKEPSGSIKRGVAKILLNSPYGKTAMNGINDIKRYYIDDNLKCVKSEIIGYECQDDAFQYLPQAICITAGARRLLLTTAQKIGFKNIMYMDTDSIKFIGELPNNIDIDDNKLGAWKLEGEPELFKTIAPKKYVYFEDRRLHYTCAGISKKVLADNMKHTKIVSKKNAIKYMELFDTGLELECLQSKKVEGGRALLLIKKKIN